MGAAQNKKLMQELFAGIANGDSTRFRDCLADDFRLTVPGRNSWSQTFEGKGRALRDLYGYVRSRLSEPGKTVAERFIAEDDFVVVEARGDMVTKEGERYDNNYSLVYRLVYFPAQNSRFEGMG